MGRKAGSRDSNIVGVYERRDMFFQSAVDIDTSQYANAGQTHAKRTTEFFGVQYIAIERRTALASPSFSYIVPREADQLQRQFVLETSEEEPELVTRAKRESPLPLSAKPRIAGLHSGAIWTGKDFDEPLSDEFWLGNE